MKKILALFIAFYISIPVFCQEDQIGTITGEFNLNLKSYQEDSLIEAEKIEEVVLSNAYLNINYTRGNFATGIRYESYLNVLDGYDVEFQGNGIAYKYITYSIDGLEVTAGNYYEQLGSGLIFRSYEERGLGIDNAMDGIRLKYRPFNGAYLKGFIGKSRTHFTYADGLFRGFDGEFNLNEIFQNNNKTKIILGGSFVSRYQERSVPNFQIPQNVGAYSSRLNLIRGAWNYSAEYAYKFNDPAGGASEKNYAAGNAIKNNLTFSKKGFGFSIDFQRVDNMEFKSDRDKDGQAYLINYVPTLSKQHTYALLALYPYATNFNGEIGTQIDIYLKLKKGSFLGGKYGTKIGLNFSRMNALSGEYGQSFLNDNIAYKPDLFSFNEELYFQDINLEITRKINRKIRTNFVLANQTYNRDAIEGHPYGTYGVLNSSIIVADISYKISKKHSVRAELQTLISKQLEDYSSDPLSGNYENGMRESAEGNWSMGLIEYTISPNWFFSIQDMYNTGNEYETKKLHYLNIDIGFIKGANRFEIGYGKKRKGIFCAGGVCKPVPSSNGFSLTVSSTF